jgi:hypothetical protein
VREEELGCSMNLQDKECYHSLHWKVGTALSDWVDRHCEGVWDFRMHLAGMSFGTEGFLERDTLLQLAD